MLNKICSTNTNMHRHFRVLNHPRRLRSEYRDIIAPFAGPSSSVRPVIDGLRALRRLLVETGLNGRARGCGDGGSEMFDES